MAAFGIVSWILRWSLWVTKGEVSKRIVGVASSRIAEFDVGGEASGGFA